jgi:hypothetical protein
MAAAAEACRLSSSDACRALPELPSSVDAEPGSLAPSTTVAFEGMGEPKPPMYFCSRSPAKRRPPGVRPGSNEALEEVGELGPLAAQAGRAPPLRLEDWLAGSSTCRCV